MANGRQRTSGIFSGIVLITIGVLFLLHNYSGFRIGYILTHYWPLILIFWGVVKLFERTLAQREGRPGGWITPGEVLLVIGLLALAGMFISYDYFKTRIPPNLIEIGNPFTFDVTVPPKTIPSIAPVDISTGHGDISVRSSGASEIRISGTKSIRTWDSRDADKLAAPVSIEIAKDKGTYEVQPVGYDINDTRFSVDMDAVVPRHSPLTVRSAHGSISVSDMGAGVSAFSHSGDIEISDTTGGVSVDTRRGDVRVTDTKGDVRISNSSNEVAGEVSVVSASGSLSINGEFFGPIRAEKISRGVRFLSQQTDLTLSHLTGHMEIGPGNLEIADAPGNISLRTRSKDVSIENPSARVNIADRDASVDVRFSSPPKDDVQISNSSAGITLSLPASSSFQIQADCHSCDIQSDFSSDSLKKTATSSGDSHLEGNYGSGCGPRITLKTSYGSIILRKTS